MHLIPSQVIPSPQLASVVRRFTISEPPRTKKSRGLPPEPHLNPTVRPEVTGYIENDISSHISNTLAYNTYHTLHKLHAPIISPSLYDQQPPPDFPYLRATSSYSAVAQLYIRAGQLDCALSLSNRIKDGTQPWCRFGCATFETPHHIFVHCPRFARFRQQAAFALHTSTSTLLDIHDTPPTTRNYILRHIDGLFSDCEIWPLNRTLYYHGVLPNLSHLADNAVQHGNQLTKDRLHSRLSGDWHTASIRLAARIWGLVKRLHNPKSTQSLPKAHNITLPQHLTYLLPPTLRTATD